MKDQRGNGAELHRHVLGKLQLKCLEGTVHVDIVCDSST